jgi:hypothetical protein
LRSTALGLPPKRITINLAPADLAKEAAILICRSRWRGWVSMDALPTAAT